MKTRTIYRCSSCGHVSQKWLGKCPACETWGSLVEEIQQKTSASSKRTAVLTSTAMSPLSDVQTDNAQRILTPLSELNRVLGGGFVPGSVVLVGGDPGIGKSTLTLQVAAAVGSTTRPALIVTGEESLHQIKQRAVRLGLDSSNVVVASETRVEQIAALVEATSPSMVIVDSIQTVVTELLESSAGSVAQVRECTAAISRVAKANGIPAIVIGHVTKDGMIAGPKVLEHMVDTVLQFEGDGMYAYRILRALKNRYGSTNELGVFEMTSSGMHEVLNPSEVLLSNRRAGEPGTAVAAVMEGTRPLLVEVQALVSASGYSVPQRVSTGYDSKRLQLILAVLEKRGGVAVRQSDVFVNVAGGVSIQDPAIDLGIAVALASSVMDKPLPPNAAFVGELGLTGEIRSVGFVDQRVQEAMRLGLQKVYVPDSGKTIAKGTVRVDKIRLVLSEFF